MNTEYNVYSDFFNDVCGEKPNHKCDCMWKKAKHTDPEHLEVE